MRILITGALGHIGSYLIREFPKSFGNLELVLVDNLSTQRYSSLFNLPKNVKTRFYELDVSKADIEFLVTDVDAVIHLAAITNATGSFDQKEEVETVNYNATVKVANACVRTNTPMIHLSSTSVYGTQNNVVDESCGEDELKPQSPYAETKLREEKYLLALGESSGLNFTVCRFGTICGTSTGMRFHTAVNKFCWQAVMGQPISVWRTALHQKRPYLALDEASEALKFIIVNRLFDRQIYNIVSENLTVNDVIESIGVHVFDISIQYVDTKIMNQLSYEVLNHRFKSKGFNYSGNVRRCIVDTLKLLNQEITSKAET